MEEIFTITDKIFTVQNTGIIIIVGAILYTIIHLIEMRILENNLLKLKKEREENSWTKKQTGQEYVQQRITETNAMIAGMNC